VKIKKQAVHCRECGHKLPGVWKEDQSRNGVRVIVTHHRNGGTTVDASCSCFGSPMRAHDHDSCPNRLRLLATG
jgi:hypothetical protein